MKTLVGTPDPADDWGSGKGSFGGDWYGQLNRMRKHSYSGDPSTQSRKFAPDLLPGDAKTLKDFHRPLVTMDNMDYINNPRPYPPFKGKESGSENNQQASLWHHPPK